MKSRTVFENPQPCGHDDHDGPDDSDALNARVLHAFPDLYASHDPYVHDDAPGGFYAFVIHLNLDVCA